MLVKKILVVLGLTATTLTAHAAKWNWEYLPSGARWETTTVDADRKTGHLAYRYISKQQEDGNFLSMLIAISCLDRKYLIVNMDVYTRDGERVFSASPADGLSNEIKDIPPNSLGDEAAKVICPRHGIYYPPKKLKGT